MNSFVHTQKSCVYIDNEDTFITKNAIVAYFFHPNDNINKNLDGENSSLSLMCSFGGKN